MPNVPTIPEIVTVHLGRPDQAAPNVTVTFPDYIKNVASSEIYPTWPDEAIRANILAEISFALNRVYTEYYRNQGYDFDITSSTAADQSFVYGREVFGNVSRIVDEIFNSYIRRRGFVEPLFAVYCDGIEVSCDGLSQWGTVSLAKDGLSAMEILKTYFGSDIELVTNVPVGATGSAPPVPLRDGSAGPYVETLQTRLNRISANYPLIPKIYPANGFFGQTTENAVKAFQSAFDLTPDGIVGPATWYRIQNVYVGVKRLSDLNSEGLTFEEITTSLPETLSRGDTGELVFNVQYYLSYIGEFIDSIPVIGIDGNYGILTENAVKAFQETYGLPVTGVIDAVTWYYMYNVYSGIIENIPLIYTEGVTVPFPGVVLQIGSDGNAVRLLQNYLNYIAGSFSDIPEVPVTGYYGTQTENAVTRFQNLFGIAGDRGVVTGLTWKAITDIYDDLYFGRIAAEGQYPGYDLSLENP